MQMQIAMIRPAKDPVSLGGYNVQEIGLAAALLDMGVSTDIYIQIDTPRNQFIEYRKNSHGRIRIYSLKGIPLFGRNEVYPQLFGLLHRGAYDIIQSLDDNMLMSIAALRWGREHRVQTVLHQGMYECFTGYKKAIQHVYDFFFQALLRSSTDIVIAKTRMAADYLRVRGFDNIRVLPVGLDVRHFARGLPMSDSMIEEFGKKHAKILLYVGKIEKRRQVDFLIRVLRKLRYNLDAGLIIVGDGPEKAHIEDLVDALEVAPHVLFAGKIPQISLSGLYGMADVFLLPSRYEIFGMVVLESLYHGVPVVSTPTGGPLDILQEQYLGQCVEADVEEWSQTILDMFAAEEEIYKRHRREYVLEKYNWESLAQRYMRIVDTLFGKSNGMT